VGNRIRLAAVAIAAAALVTAVAPASAGAQEAGGSTPPGVGSTTGTTTLLGLRIGGAGGPLDLRLIGEQGTTLLDSLEAAPNALARVLPLSLSSSLLPTLSALSLPAIESRSTGAENTQSTSLLDLGALSEQLGLPGLLGGQIQPASLLTAVDAAGARSLVSSAVTGITALGGVLGLDALTLDLGSLAAPGQSNAERGVTLASLDVLTLDGLLGLLGIALEDLPLDAALGLLDSLGLPLSGLGVSSVGELDGLLDELLTNIGGLLGSVVGGACDPLAPILGLLGIDCTMVSDTVVDLVDQLRGLVVGIVDTLTGTPLLSFEGISLDVIARAGETVATSVADVVSTIGGVRVAGIDLPGIDVESTLRQVEALVDQITGTLNGVLGGVLPSLGNLLDVDLLDEATSVVQTATGVTASSAVTGLRITVTPPNLCDLLSGLGGSNSLGALLGGVTDALGPVTDLLGGLGLGLTCDGTAGTATASGLVDGLATALTSPLTIEALSVSEAAVLRLPAPTGPGTPSNPAAPPTALARTGMPDTVPMALAGLLVGLSLLVRRRVVAVRAVKID
jgi:hypothetical protein